MSVVQPAALFSSDRDFRMWLYNVSHLQLLLRSGPSAGERCLDLHFEGVSWLSLPASLHTIRITLAAEGEPVLPPEIERGVQKFGCLRLAISTRGASGSIVCGRARAALTASTWSGPTDWETADLLWSRHRNGPG